MQYAHPLSWEARIRISSRTRGRSPPGRVPWSRPGPAGSSRGETPARGFRTASRPVVSPDIVGHCHRHSDANGPKRPGVRSNSMSETWANGVLGLAPRRVRNPGAPAAGGCAPRRDQIRPPGRGHPAAVLAHAGGRARHCPQHGGRGLHPADRRGLAHRPRRARAPPSRRCAARPPTPVPRRPRRPRIPATTCGRGSPTCPRSRAASG